jgi:hypothetical protein
MKIIAALLLSATASFAAPNTLTPAEKEQGWKLLFDGKSTTGWHGFQKEALPDKGWIVEDGCLKCLGKKGGDIITTEKFSDFELCWEWKMSQKGNSGVKYLIDEKRLDAKGKVYTGAIGHEYQMLDDNEHPDRANPTHRSGAWYDVVAPKDAKLKPVGEFNESRLIIQGKHVEHWLNGGCVVSYEMDSPESLAGIAKSKFKDVPGFASKIATPILLQDHNDVVWVRSIKIRPLSPAGK